MKHCMRCVLAVLVIGLSLGPLRAFGQETKDKPVLEQILDLMLQRGQIDSEQYRTLQEKAKKEQTAGFQAGIENGRPFFKSADDNFHVTLGGRVQLDFDAAEEGTSTLTGARLGSQFLVRRARLEVEGRFFRWVDFVIETDFAGASAILQNGYLDLTFLPELRFRAGQFKAPFSLEELTSSRFIDFVERSLINELAPARDIGIMVHGSLMKGVASYFLGGFNGAGQNVADNNPDKDVVGRFVLVPFKDTNNFWIKGIQVGGNFTWGNQSSRPSAQGRTGARTSNRFTYFAAQPTRGDRLRYGGDLVWLVGPAALKFEYSTQTNERIGLGPGRVDLDEVRAEGWYVSATYLITGEEKRLSATVTPKYQFNPVTGKWGPGAWEVGIRYAELTFESDDPVNFFNGNIASAAVIPGRGRTAENGAQALTVGVNWYPNSRTRVMLNWTNNWYDNVLGTPFSCPSQIITCSASNLQPGDDSSWEFLSRLQIYF